MLAQILKKEGQSLIVLLPVSDKEKKIRLGDINPPALKQALDSLLYVRSNLMTSDYQIIIPLALLGMRHWVTLHLVYDLQQPTTVQATLYDSKGWLSYFYLFYYKWQLKKLLKASLEKDIVFRCKPLGQQGIRNHVDCGWFVHHYSKACVEAFVDGQTLSSDSLQQLKSDDSTLAAYDRQLESLYSQRLSQDKMSCFSQYSDLDGPSCNISAALSIESLESFSEVVPQAKQSSDPVENDQPRYRA